MIIIINTWNASSATKRKGKEGKGKEKRREKDGI